MSEVYRYIVHSIYDYLHLMDSGESYDMISSYVDVYNTSVTSVKITPMYTYIRASKNNVIAL